MSKRRNAVQYVKAESVPLCLRHSCSQPAVEQAQWLAVFLQEAVEGLLSGGTVLSDECRLGLGLTFDLLRDKLAIASGALPFPMTQPFGEADKVLWDPEQGGGDE